jgi:peptidoglycan hydrolase FlgJ
MSVNAVSISYPLTAASKGPAAIDRNSELYKVSQDFEALLIKQMLDAMRKTINKDDELLSTTSNGQGIYEDMLYDEYARSMSQTAGFGLADSIYRELSSK